ncbi:MAG: endonuclease III [Candidatus Bathyarchaeia archaeon]
MSNDKNIAEKILQMLSEKIPLPAWVFSSSDPFETLILTIISQNTSDINAKKAFENLSKRFAVTPKALASAEIEEIADCLRIAGLYRNKARAIREVSSVILEKFGGSLKPILSMPLEDARKTLKALRGVGPKTADVLLLFSANQPTVPVDTHVKRVSKRLGLAPVKGNYEVVRRSLQLLYKPDDYLKLHILLILLGRKYCKAKNPACNHCPVSNLCQFARAKLLAEP